MPRPLAPDCPVTLLARPHLTEGDGGALWEPVADASTWDVARDTVAATSAPTMFRLVREREAPLTLASVDGACVVFGAPAWERRQSKPTPESDEVHAWCAQHDWFSAWAECDRAAWMLSGLVQLDWRRTLLACVSVARWIMGGWILGDDDYAHRAAAACEAFARGRLDGSELPAPPDKVAALRRSNDRYVPSCMMADLVGRCMRSDLLYRFDALEWWGFAKACVGHVESAHAESRMREALRDSVTDDMIFASLLAHGAATR